MASTYLSLHYHVIFATKDRRPMIADEWRDRLHTYLGGLAKKLNGFPQGVGGVADHVHALIGLPGTIAISDFVRDFKKRSSVWIHEELGVQPFQWQTGFAAFTVGANARGGVKTYIANQEEHHRVKSSSEELRELLAKAGLEYDERYFE